LAATRAATVAIRASALRCAAARSRAATALTWALAENRIFTDLRAAADNAEKSAQNTTLR